ncbi:hypothetical protein MHYP_G00205800 [Metynnis hypsauchen]
MELYYSSSGGGTSEPKEKSAVSPEPSCVSMKSDGSMIEPPRLSSGAEPSHTDGGEEPSCVSMKSDRSMIEPPRLSSGGEEPSCVSMKSDRQHSTNEALHTQTLVEGSSHLQQNSYRPADDLLHGVIKIHKTSMKNKYESILEGIKTEILTVEKKVLDELDLKKCNTSEEGYRRLIPAVTACRKAILAGCYLTKDSCETLCSALQSANSNLKELDLSNNDLQDSGVGLLSAGLRNPYCKLEIISLSGCMVTDEGCSSLALALKSNPSHLRELDLTYNYPGESGVKLLSDLLENPCCKLEKLQVEFGGKNRIKPGIKKYACDLTLDPNTAHPHLSLSEGNRKEIFQK